MRIIRTIAAFALAIMIVMAALTSYKQTGVEAGWKSKVKKSALLAALLLHGGKKIVLPLPIPLPIPILKQTQPIYYQQQSYYQPPSYPSYPSYSSSSSSSSSYGGQSYY